VDKQTYGDDMLNFK